MTTLITLKYGQTVRGRFTGYTQRITVGTVRGYEAEHGTKYNLQTDPERAHQIALKHGHATAWTNQAPAVLTADYPGKAERNAKERAEIAAAPLLEDRQRVIIEGDEYEVRLAGPQYDCPIAFERII